MSKKLILIILISISVITLGCESQNIKQSHTLSANNSQTTNTDNPDNTTDIINTTNLDNSANYTDTTSSSLKTEGYTNWNGIWGMDNAYGIGASAVYEIHIHSDFSISCCQCMGE